MNGGNKRGEEGRGRGGQLCTTIRKGQKGGGGTEEEGASKASLTFF